MNASISSREHRSSSPSARATSMPASRRTRIPLPRVRSSGSRQPTTTRASSASMTAVVHGGVRPKCEQGSRVQTRVAPRACAPGGPERHDLGVRQARPVVPALGDEPSFAQDHRAHQRVRAHPPRPVRASSRARASPAASAAPSGLILRAPPVPDRRRWGRRRRRSTMPTRTTTRPRHVRPAASPAQSPRRPRSTTSSGSSARKRATLSGVVGMNDWPANPGLTAMQLT